jgi:NTP pyrophosphatase (non-canonical NTP hydrolase)
MIKLELTNIQAMTLQNAVIHYCAEGFITDSEAAKILSLSLDEFLARKNYFLKDLELILGSKPMNLPEYQIAAMRTAGDTLSDQLTGLVTAALGIAGETGELVEVYAHNQGKDKFIKEAGDCLWYVARACQALDINMDIFGDALDDLTTPSNVCVYLAISGAGFADTVKKNFAQGHPVDKVLLMAHLRGYMGLLSRMCLTRKVTISAVADANVAKLRERFPDGFSVERSVGR